MPGPMRVLMVGAGGVGDAAARIAVERDFFEAWVVADYDLGARRAHRRRGGARGVDGRGALHAPRRSTPPTPTR